MQKVLSERERPPHMYTFISGIGCSSRFPLYMSTYGFHTIHGRALAVATGVKAANPKQEVWVITGDGDCLSIGGNHFMHAMRRNQDLKVLLFNNEIYGLTKGQYSPTSKLGMINKSAPFGTIDNPVSPIRLALAAGATFVARTADNDINHMTETLRRAADHKGSAFVEILQNCVIFADKVHEDYYGVKTRKDSLIYLHDGEPLLYGKTVEKGMAIDGFKMEGVEAASNKSRIAIHDEKEETGTLANMLASLTFPESPVPLGVFRDVDAPGLPRDAARPDRERQESRRRARPEQAHPRFQDLDGGQLRARSPRSCRRGLKRGGASLRRCPFFVPFWQAAGHDSGERDQAAAARRNLPNLDATGHATWWAHPKR